MGAVKALLTLGPRECQEKRSMKILTRKSQTLSYSPELMLSPTMAHVNAACRKDLVSFVRKVFHGCPPALFFR